MVGLLGSKQWSLWLIALALAAPAVTAADLAPRHERFLDHYSVLMSEREREVFDALDRDYHRDAFVERFWQVRDPFPQTQRNEFREAAEANVELAKERLSEVEGDRAKTILLHGLPQRTSRYSCDLLRPLETWYYSQSPLVPGEFSLIFVRLGGRHSLWRPSSGLTEITRATTSLDVDGSEWPPAARLNEREAMSLDLNEAARRIAESCSRGDDLMAALSIALDWERLETNSRALARPNSEWADSFMIRSTQVPDGAEELEGTLTFTFPRRHQSRTVVQAVIEVPPDGAVANDQGGFNFLLDGEILRAGELFDDFRYRFDLPPGDETLPIVAQRYLRPGRYDVVLKVKDVQSERYFHAERSIDVPRVKPQPTPEVSESTTAPAVEAERVTEDLFAEANAQPSVTASLSESHSVRLNSPPDTLVVGRYRATATTQGDGIAQVAFEVDGKEVLRKRRAPYSAEVNLGDAPLVHVISAKAYDQSGALLARDTVEINSGPHRFDVRLIEPSGSERFRGSLRAVAEVRVPRLERLDRLELFLNETRVATLYQPPFVQPMQVPDDQRLAYVRAVGYLESGGSAEDLVFVNTPNQLDQVSVSLVELYATVLDRKGNQIDDLAVEEFEVLDEKKAQTIRRFELVRDLPIHAGILLDTSTSMLDHLEEAEEAAAHFFEQVLTERDRACLITYNDDPQLEVGFTGQVGVLAGGLAGLEAEGGTALHDSLIYALYYFGGIRGRRALVLISDGEDSDSEYSFDEVVDFARRSGVTIYSVGLGLDDRREIVARNRLSTLCRETGGRCFFISSAGELKDVYERIESELRKQYLLAFQPGPPEDSSFREVEVKVTRKGLKVRTRRGYFPD